MLNTSVLLTLVMLVVFSVLGTFGNAVTVLVFYKKRNAGTNVLFVLVLAGHDLFTCMVTIPVTVIFIVLRGRLVFDAACQLYIFITASTIPFTIFIIFGIAVDRYFKICHPFNRIMNQNKAKLIIVFTFAVSVTCGTISGLFFVSDGLVPPTNTTTSTNISAFTENDISSIFLASGANYDPMADLSLIQDYEMMKVTQTNNENNATGRKHTILQKRDTGVCTRSFHILSKQVYSIYVEIYMKTVIGIYVIITFLYVLVFQYIYAHRDKMSRLKGKAAMNSNIANNPEQSSGVFSSSHKLRSVSRKISRLHGAVTQQPKRTHRSSLRNPESAKAGTTHTIGSGSTLTGEKKSTQGLGYRDKEIIQSETTSFNSEATFVRSIGMRNKEEIATEERSSNRKTLTDTTLHTSMKKNEEFLNEERRSRKTLTDTTLYTSGKKKEELTNEERRSRKTVTYLQEELAVLNSKSPLLTPRPSLSLQNDDAAISILHIGSQRNSQAPQGVLSTPTTTNVHHNTADNQPITEENDKSPEKLHSSTKVDPSSTMVSTEISQTQITNDTSEVNSKQIQQKTTVSNNTMTNLKTALTLFMVTFAFLVTYFPAILARKHVIPRFFILDYFYYLNNAINPLIFIVMSGTFREDVKVLLKNFYTFVRCTK